MSENPFESPSISNEPPPPRDRAGKRPLLLGLIAAFHLIGGIGSSVMLVLAAASPDFRPWLGAGTDAVVFVVTTTPRLLLAFAVFFGIWRRPAWGWWVAVFSYCLGAMERLIGGALILLPDANLGMPAQGQPPIALMLAPMAFGLLITCLLLAYLFTSRVVEYFRVEEVNRGKALGVLAAAAFLVGLATTALTTFLTAPPIAP